MNTTKIIAWLTAIMVAIIAVLSFILSYAALYEMALSNGYSATLAMIWPLLIDAPLVVFSLAVVNAYLHNESTHKQWILVGIYTLLTIFFNALHAPTTGDIIPVSVAPILPLIVAIIAPVSLFFSFEMLMQQLKNSVKRSELYESIKELEKELKVKLQKFSEAVGELESNHEKAIADYNQAFSTYKAQKEAILDELQSEIDSLDAAIIDKQDLISDKEVELERLQQAIEALAMSDVDKRQADMMQYLKQHPTATADDLAERYQVSTQTIYSDWRKMKEKSILQRENNEWIVNLNGVG